jgi:hypothetical protein
MGMFWSYEVKRFASTLVGIEYFLIVRGRNMATQVKERVRVCNMPSVIGKCEQIFNEKLVVNALNLSTEA